MFGFTEAISLLLALGGLGVDANPKAPSADVVLEHYVDDADVILHFDAAAVIPRNYKVIANLSKDPVVQASPSLRELAQKLNGEIESGRGLAKGMVGIDPTSDVTSVTVFLKFQPGVDPQGLVAVRGTLPADLVKKVSALTGGKVDTVDGRAAIAVDNETYLGTTRSGVLLMGPAALVKPRLADAWKATPRAKGFWQSVAATVGQKPFLVVGVRPSAAMLKELASSQKNAVSDLVSGLDFGTLSFHHDGLQWSWVDKSDVGARRIKLASEGFVELIRSFHVAPRGLAKIMVAGLESYAGQSKEIDAVIQRKDDILKLVDGFTGDGRFKAAITLNKTTVSARLSAKHLSEVLPLGFLAPAAAIAYATEEQKEEPLKGLVVQPAAPGARPGAKPAAKPAGKPAPAPRKPAPAPAPKPR